MLGYAGRDGEESSVGQGLTDVLSLGAVEGGTTERLCLGATGGIAFRAVPAIT